MGDNIIKFERNQFTHLIRALDRVSEAIREQTIALKKAAPEINISIGEEPQQQIFVTGANHGDTVLPVYDADGTVWPEDWVRTHGVENYPDAIYFFATEAEVWGNGSS